MGTLGGNLCQRPRCWYYRSDFRCLRKGGDVCYAVDGENEFLAILGGGPCFIVHPSDLAPALVALDAQVGAYGPGGPRTIAARDFFVGVDQSLRRETVLASAEIVTHVDLPPQRAGARGAYLKAMDRGAWSFALASVAVLVTLDGPTVTDARIVLGGVAPTPWRCPAAEQALIRGSLTAEAIETAAARATDGAAPMSQNGYKVELVRRLVARSLTDLADGL
jgi:xanthine dehydrogenase YagS FAD-binding subunit